MSVETQYCSDGDNEKRKRMSTGLQVNCPHSLRHAIQTAYEFGYHFIITQITHPNYARELLKTKPPPAIGRTDRILQSLEWSRYIVAELTTTINVDSEIDLVQRKSKALFLQELGFAIHLGVPVIKFSLTKRNNAQLGRLINEKLVGGFNSSFWVTLPMVHPSQHSPICTEEEKEDSWEWWNDFRTYCNYDKHVGLILELPDIKCIPTKDEIDRWIGEPLKALIIPTSYFLMNNHGKLVLSRAHQELIHRFLSIDVQYVIKSDTDGDLSVYTKYLHFLGKKLYVGDSNLEFIQGCEDFLQNPLQPLTEHLETNIYEVFEKDQIKYTTYQNAIHKALEDVPQHVTTPVIMIVGAGRGPLVQAALNVSYILQRKVKVYAVEKNPFAINTLIDRVNNEWNGQVTLINEDMRVYEPPEKADILVSELLGSFGDNELSPECLDGAQRFIKRTGISIPCSYTSYLAPLQSIKIFNEIRNNRPADKSIRACYETPYVIHLVNYYQIATAQPLFKFEHPNWSDTINNERYRKLRFNTTQSCILTGFVGFFDTVLYKDVTLSIHPETHTHEMVSWFPIVFPLMEPIKVTAGAVIEISFWRVENLDKVWYEWCLESPVKGCIMNPGGRSYSIKKH